MENTHIYDVYFFQFFFFRLAQTQERSTKRRLCFESHAVNKNVHVSSRESCVCLGGLDSGQWRRNSFQK